MQGIIIRDKYQNDYEIKCKDHTVIISESGKVIISLSDVLQAVLSQTGTSLSELIKLPVTGE